MTVLPVPTAPAVPMPVVLVVVAIARSVHRSPAKRDARSIPEVRRTVAVPCEVHAEHRAPQVVVVVAPMAIAGRATAVPRIPQALARPVVAPGTVVAVPSAAGGIVDAEGEAHAAHGHVTEQPPRGFRSRLGQRPAAAISTGTDSAVMNVARMVPPSIRTDITNRTGITKRASTAAARMRPEPTGANGSGVTWRVRSSHGRGRRRLDYPYVGTAGILAATH